MPHEITVISGLVFGNKNNEQWGKSNVRNDFFEFQKATPKLAGRESR